MPEPVVIIGPAKGPAGPIGEPADAADRVAQDDTGLPRGHAPKTGKGKKSMLSTMLARLGSGLFMLLTRGLLTIAKLGMSVANRYPRHSLAAGASLVILGAISYSQSRSGIPRRPPVPNEIKGASSTDSPAAPKDSPKTKTDGPAATADTIASKNASSAGAANPDDKLMASPGAGAPEDRAAPASTLATTDGAPPPLPPPLTAAPTAGQDSEQAPEKAAPAADVAAAKSEPAPTPAPPVDLSTPTLLGSDLPGAAPSSSSPVVKDDKRDGDAVKPAPAVEAPALITALVPSQSPAPEVASAPALAGDPVQLAATGEDQNKSSATSASKPPPQSPASGSPHSASTTGETANADSKPNEARAPAEPKTVLKPQDAPKTNPGPQSNPASSQPESTPGEIVKSEPPKPESAKVEAPAPVALGPADNPNPPKPENAKVEAPAPVALGTADNPKVAPAAPVKSGVRVPESEVAGNTKLPVESSAAQLETPATTAQNTPSQPTIPPPAPVTPLDSQAQIPDSRSQVTESPPQVSGTKEPDARPRAISDLASAGWVSVPNSGKILFEDATNADGPRDDSSSGVGAESAVTRDVRAHAAKDMSFELESPQARGTTELDQNGRRSVLASTGAPEPRSGSAVGRVEPNAHVVEPLENFWTISRLYYSSGRYYRALWKANAAKYPEIDRLKVNDVIMVPAVEDLDPAYIDPSPVRAPASLRTARNSGGRSRGSTRDNGDGLAESSESSSTTAPAEPISTARTNRGSGDAVPVRRSSRTDPDLDLPAADAVSRRDSASERTGRGIDRPLGDDDANDEPETRTAARPRAAAAYSKRRPVYKIRPNETLRSIARDMLGDSHRSSEILELNRDLIDDPAHLIVGQVIELPDDARTSVRRSASR